MSDSSLSPDEPPPLLSPTVPATPSYCRQEMDSDLVSHVNKNTLLLLFAFGILTNVILSSVELDSMRGWSYSEMVHGILIGNWDRYSRVLCDHPITTKAVTSGVVYAIGDVLAQQTEGNMNDLDVTRTIRSSAAGFIGHGPLSHCWYNFSEGLFTDTLQWTAWWSFIPKVVLDQSLWGPIWNNTYILLLGLMKRDSIDTIWSDVKRTTIPLVMSGLKLWPLAHCVTYGLIPVEHRLLWVDSVEILWVTILATQAAGAVKLSMDPTIATTTSTTTGSSSSSSSGSTDPTL